MDDLSRIEKYICQDGYHIPGLALPCWTWTGVTDDKHRPRIKIAGNSLMAKRALYQLHGISLADEDNVISLCKNKGCLRPEHLVIGTPEDAFRFSRFGNVGPGDMYLVKKMYENEEIGIFEVKEFFGITRPAAEAILAEGSLIKRSQPPYSHCTSTGIN